MNLPSHEQCTLVQERLIPAGKQLEDGSMPASRSDACDWIPTGSSGAATDTSSTAEEDSDAELLESMQLVEAAQKEVLAERRVLGFARDGLSVEAGSDSSGRMEDAEFRLQKDGWLLISRFFEEQLGLQALGLVKSMTQ